MFINVDDVIAAALTVKLDFPISSFGMFIFILFPSKVNSFILLLSLNSGIIMFFTSKLPFIFGCSGFPFKVISDLSVISEFLSSETEIVIDFGTIILRLSNIGLFMFFIFPFKVIILSKEPFEFSLFIVNSFKFTVFPLITASAVVTEG